MKDPQIISRTGLTGLGTMRLNSSSSCASLDHHRLSSIRNSRSNLENDAQLFNKGLVSSPHMNDEFSTLSPSIMI